MFTRLLPWNCLWNRRKDTSKPSKSDFSGLELKRFLNTVRGTTRQAESRLESTPLIVPDKDSNRKVSFVYLPRNPDPGFSPGSESNSVAISSNKNIEP